MKRCPVCNRVYSEDDLNFCLDDGNVLQDHDGEEPTRPLKDMPPTIVLDPPRVTNPIGWNAGQNIEPFRSQQSVYHPPGYQPYQMTASPNQTLAILSISLDAGSLVIGWCCSNGLLLACGDRPGHRCYNAKQQRSAAIWRTAPGMGRHRRRQFVLAGVYTFYYHLWHRHYRRCFY